jgi:hypothetical protein
MFVKSLIDLPVNPVSAIAAPLRPHTDGRQQPMAIAEVVTRVSLDMEMWSCVPDHGLFVLTMRSKVPFIRLRARRCRSSVGLCLHATGNETKEHVGHDHSVVHGRCFGTTRPRL